MSAQRRIVANYAYTDAGGKLLFEVVRFDPKDFRQRTPNGNGWRWGLNGTAPVLYRLDRLAKAERPAAVFLVEGEKDVHAVEELGLLGTTAPMGAGKWHSHYSESLRGFHVYILPDNDEPGLKHADFVAKALAGIAEITVVVELPGLPPKGDISDWLLLPGNDREKLLQLCEEALKLQRFAFTPGDAYEGPKPSANDGRRKTPERVGYFFSAIDSAKFAAADYRLEWLVKGLMVRGQPAVIGGPRKGMKTSIVIDLALALGTARDFLGTFAVPKAYRVLLASGESGPHTIQETARRVCLARGIDLASASNCFWDFQLPQLSNDSDLGELQRGLHGNGIDVAMIDPLYLALLGGSDLQASSMYDMGPLFLKVARACLDVGCTPILIHHFRQTRQSNEPPDLGDLAFAGIQEFARQWLLLGRRDAYAPGTGQHRLWLSAGGSIGHGGLWAVDVDEGQLGEDFSGRTWHVNVTTQTEAIQARKDEAQTAKRQKERAKESEQETRLLQALDGLAGPDGVAGLTKVRDAAGLRSDAMTQTVLRLKSKGIIEEVLTAVALGTGNKTNRTVPGLRRVREND